MIRSKSQAVLLALLSLAVLILVLGPGKPALAGETLVPTRFDDPAPDGCQPSDCSLREAIMAANAAPGLDTIRLGAGTYSVSLPGPDDGQPADGDLNVHSAVRLIGEGASATTISGGGQGRVAFVSEAGSLYVSGVTVRGGNSAVNGGGILNIGSLTVADSVFRENTGDLGGAIASGGGSGWLTLDRVTLINNVATRSGGGLFLADLGSTATIKNSTISGNTTSDSSGGVHVQSGAVVDLVNVTISGNSSPSPVALSISSAAAVTLTSATIAANNSSDQFGAVANYEAQLTLRNAIIQDIKPACWGDGVFESQGHNIHDGSCGAAGPGDQLGVDPHLDPLADNGGPTQTHALQANSLAIDNGDPTVCPFTDQRGYGRVGTCDIGAFEYGASPAVIKQGDVNCDNVVNGVDGLLILRSAAQLPAEADCLGIAGDVDCQDGTTEVDMLAVLRFAAGLTVPPVQGCAGIGTPV